MSIRYIAYIALRSEWPPERATAAAGFVSPVYVFEIGQPEGSNYWTDWGGTYDNPDRARIELYFGEFLQQVTSIASLEAVENTFYIDGVFVYMHLPQPPWLYKETETELLVKKGYQTSVRDSSNPSDDTYTDAIFGKERYPTKLSIPSIVLQLSDPISAAKLFTKFKLSFINNDGGFDDIRDLNIENTPITLERSDVDIPDLDDFNVIRKGLVDSISVTEDTFTISCADIFTTLTEQATNKFSINDYPDLPDTNLDKDIPIGFNSLVNVPLFEVGTNQYIALDPGYLNTVSAVYDSDGVSLSFSVSNGIITATDAETADVIGKNNYTIGDIITEEIELKSGVVYNSDNWDTDETDNYISISAKVGFYYKGGTVKALVTQVLKSDSAYLFTKNNGKLTLRQDGQQYANHYLESWQIMKIPNKSTEESQKYYASSIAVNFIKEHKNSVYERTYVDDSMQAEIEGQYRREVQGSFDTDLLTLAKAQDLSERLLNRFGTIYELVEVAISESTINIAPLDTVFLDMVINNRTFSRFNEWKVRKVDPAQDILLLESVDTVTIDQRIIDTSEMRSTNTGDIRIVKT